MHRFPLALLVTLSLAAPALATASPPAPLVPDSPRLVPGSPMTPILPPAPGTLAFGTMRSALPPMLGPGRPAPADPLGPAWAYRMGPMALTMAFHNDRLAKATLVPTHSLAWPVAAAWARAFVPGLDQARWDKPAVGPWLAFVTVAVGGVPFEIEWTFERTARGQVPRMVGAMHWLD